jgi:uncharacterized alpha-E superfamily protein
MSTATTARTGLLSRIAETLFWTGRYIERAADTARMVDVYVHRMLEEPQADEDAGCSALLAVLGIPPPEATRLDIGMALDQLAYDQKSPSTIAGAVLAARSGARSVREVISSEMWECLNVTGLGLPAQRRAAERLGPHVYLRFIRERAALFFGLADSTMSRDDAWRFLVLGRSVERVDMTARMLLARMPAAPYELGWPMAAARMRRLRVIHPHAHLDRRLPALRGVPDPGPPVPQICAACTGDGRGVPGRTRSRPGQGRRVARAAARGRWLRRR